MENWHKRTRNYKEESNINSRLKNRKTKKMFKFNGQDR